MQKLKSYNIGIGCIGSGVGQSVINSCRLSNLPIKTVGFGTNPFAYGAYDCDSYDYLPSIYHEDYSDSLIEKCKLHNIDLFIPGLDDEVLTISENIEKFHETGILVIVSKKELINLCRKKEKLGDELSKLTDVFVRSYNKNDLLDSPQSNKIEFPMIAKPRGGFASRGIEIIHCLDDLKNVSEDSIIQELALPNKNDPNYDIYFQNLNKKKNLQVSEISIQVITDVNGKLIGRMASYNKLNNGVPIEVLPFENKEVWNVVDKLFPTLVKLGLRGPINIQGRITDKGLRLFEMNPRFTGITGLRAIMGFNEVEACIKSWLNINNNEALSLTLNDNRFGIRQTADKSIPIEHNDKVHELYLKLNEPKLTNKKTILITGASGYLGQNFINEIVKDSKYRILAYSRDKSKIEHIYKNDNIKCYDKKDFDTGKLILGHVDVILHFGFARAHCSTEQISDSLAFTEELFIKAALHNVPAIINISSQSVYGLSRTPPWKESLTPTPETPYAMAKYASEILANSVRRICKHTFSTSLRLASVAGGENGINHDDIISKFVKKSLTGDQINIVGGNQRLERIDMRDVISAIKKLLILSPQNWQPIYNIGSGETQNIIEIAEKVIKVTRAIKGNCNSQIRVDEKDIAMEFGMSIERFSSDTGWKSKYKMEDIIEHSVNSLINQYKI